MNRIYRVVWNAAKGVWQAASELSTARSKTNSGRALRRRKLAATSLMLAGTSAMAAGALPTGGTVVAGSGSISTSGATMTINQSTGKMAIDWQGFSIGQGSSVNFVQPSASAVALNRVLGSDVSVIQGALKANGQVFLLNPNGVLFSPTAQVNVGGLVASTLNMKTEDFLSGKYQFEGASGNAVINQGNIQAAPGGTVVLIAAKITNTGSIDAAGGNVLMGAGRQVTLDFGGPVKLQVQQAAVDALIDNGGAIRADGGTILLNAKATGELVSTVINNTGLIQAQTLATGEKGQIMLLGDMHNGRVEAGGTLDASAPNGGNGGFIETSAAEVNTVSGLVVNAGAKSGTGGQWLIDPYDYTINGTAATNITNTLNNGTSVTVSTQSNSSSYGSAGNSSGSGDITVSSAITKSAGGNANLTLQADRNITVSAPITSTSGALNITLAANQARGTYGGVNVASNLSSNGGNILIGGAYTPAAGVNIPGMITGDGIGFAVNFDASHPAIAVQPGVGIKSGGGNIALNGYSSVALSGSNDPSGVHIMSGATIDSGYYPSGAASATYGGNIYISGVNATNTKAFGIYIDTPGGNGTTKTTVSASTTTGTIVLDGHNTVYDTGIGNAYAYALSLSNSGNSGNLVFTAYSVANLAFFRDGVLGTATFTYQPPTSGCRTSYPNCGLFLIDGSNNSYLYGTYNAVNMATKALYVIQTGNGTKEYDGTTAATGLTLTSLGGPSGFAVTNLTPYPAFNTASKNVGTYSDLIANSSNPKDFSSGGTSYAIGYYNTGTYTIVPRALTPIASDKVYDGTTTAAVTANGLIGSDNVTLSGTGTFDSKNVGNYEVSITDITLSGADASNYTLSSSSASAIASITKRPVTIAATKTYDGTDDLSSIVTIGNLVGNETLNYSGATANSAHVANAQYISGITLSDGSNGGLANNYQLPNLMQRAEGSNTATIMAKTLTATLTNSAVTKVYDGTTAAPAGFSPSWNISGHLAGDSGTTLGSASTAYDSKDAGVATKVTISGLTINSIASSTHGSQASDYVLDASSKEVAASITPKELTVSGMSASSKTYDGTRSATLAGGTLNGLVGEETLSFSGQTGTFDDKNVGNGKAVAVSGITLANGTGLASNYTVSNPAGLTASITPKALTVSGITASDKIYDGNTSATVNTANAVMNGLVSGDTVNVSATGAFANKNAGNNKAVSLTSTYSGADAGNYSITDQTSTTASITQKALAVSGLTASDKIYDGNTSATVNTANAVLNGLVSGDTVTVSSSGTFGDKNAGNNKTVSLTSNYGGADADNYSITGQSSTTTSITPKALTVSGITAADKIYDGDTSATVNTANAVLNGLVSGDTVGISATGVFANKNVGSNKAVSLTSTYSGADAGNYSITDQSSAAASITPKALTVSGIIAADKIYDGDTSATVSTANAVMNGLVSGDTINVAASGTFADKNVGNSKTVSLTSTYSGADAGNYSITGQSSATASITPKTLTVSGITATDKTYDGSTSATVSTVNAVMSGLVSGDTVTVSSSGTFGDKNVGNSKTVTLTSNYSGADAGNYSITSQSSTTAGITPKALTVAGITASDKIYDGNTSATVNTANAVLNGLVSGDTVNVAATGRFSDKNAGNDKTVTLASSYSGTDAGNYSIANQTSTTASITPKALTVSGITASDKTYDGNTSATVNTANAVMNGLVSGDTVNVSATGAFANKNAGSNKAVSLTSSYTGADAGNYSITDQASTSASITQKALTVSGITASDKIYDGNTSAAVSTANAVLNGLVSGDTVSVSANGTFADKNVGNNKTVTLTSNYSGADAGNYSITSQSSAAASITPKALTVSGITAADKTYDGNTSATVNTAHAVMNGLVNGDTVNVAASGAFADKNAGNGKTVNISGIALSGSDAGNYTLSSDTASATAAIAARPITVSADNQSKKSGSADPQFTWSVTGGSLVGSDTLTGGLARDPGENAGTYGIRRGTLGNGNYALSFVDGALTIASSAPAMAPAQYTSTVPNLTPPAVGGLTYVAVPDVPAGAAGTIATAAPQPPAAAPNTGAGTAAGEAPGAAPADGDATPTVVSRQKQTASQAATAGRDVKFLNVLVVSGGIQMPGDLAAPAANPSDSK